MEDTQIIERLARVEDKANSNAKRLDILEERHNKSEVILNDLDKSLSVTIEQIKTIAEDLKTTSINFKEAVTRSNNANAKETELLKEKYNELERKYEKLDNKLEQETVLKDAENWRSSKKQVWSWVLNAILLIVAVALGISKFL